MSHKNAYDVIVVGAGTSGLMAAINASQNGAKTLIIDKNPRPGKKLLLSGGTRCNVTNRTSRDNLIKHIPGNGKFLYGALNQFDQEDIIHFFESRGVALKEEDHGRMFPTTDSAKTILNCLLQELKAYNVPIIQSSPVQELVINNQKLEGVLCKNGETYKASQLILATGGKAYPKTGTTGDGYSFAKQAGHTITTLYPTEAPLLSKDWFIQDKRMKGVALRNVLVSLTDENQKLITAHQMDMIFTHFGYSGPAILRASGHVNQFLKSSGLSEVYLKVDLAPDQTTKELQETLEANRDKQVTNSLKSWMPEAMAKLLLTSLNIDETIAFKHLTHKAVDQLLQLIKNFQISAYGSKPIEKGFVTGGGVHTKEINPKTMESKMMPGLYFCGELLDINGYTGGYNITSAFVTGTVAGMHAAWKALE